MQPTGEQVELWKLHQATVTLVFCIVCPET